MRKLSEIYLYTICLFFFHGCNNSTAPNFISNLNGVSEIKFYLYEQGMILHLTNSDDIAYFLSTFRSRKRVNSHTVQSSEFHPDGYILFIQNKEKEFEVKIDTDVGYKIIIEGKCYFEPFTYLTGRYLAEIL